jgi:hypothetical protein
VLPFPDRNRPQMSLLFGKYRTTVRADQLASFLY